MLGSPRKPRIALLWSDSAVERAESFRPVATTANLMSKMDQQRIKQLVALGRDHYEKRNFSEAEGYLRQVLNQGLNYADVFHMLGVIVHDRGEYEEAETLFERALSLNPGYTEASLNLAVVYNDLGKYDEAKQIYRDVQARSDSNSGRLDPFIKGRIANLHAQVARAYADAELVAEAKHELRKAVLMCPHFSDLRLQLANLHRQQGDHAAAKYELKEAIRHRPTFVPALIALGVVELALGNPSDARVAWERALEEDEEQKTAQMYLRMLDLNESGEYDLSDVL